MDAAAPSANKRLNFTRIHSTSSAIRASETDRQTDRRTYIIKVIDMGPHTNDEMSVCLLPWSANRLSVNLFQKNPDRGGGGMIR